MNILDLLFNNKEGEAIFKNQLDLVNHLINNRNTKYFVNSTENPDAFTKMQGRLKTYISQLLSETINRTVTNEFKEGLRIVLEDRLSTPELAIEHTERIIDAIQKKNDHLGKSNSLSNMQKKFQESINTAKYIAIITSKPLEVEGIHSTNPIFEILQLVLTFVPWRI